MTNDFKQEIMDNLFAEIIFESKINDSASKKLEKLIRLCVNQQISPDFAEYRAAQLKILKSYLICNNCTWIKNSKNICSKCNVHTTNNYFTLFDIKEQVSRIVEDNISELLHYQKNIKELGYMELSVVEQFHSKNPNSLTMTLNMDGVSVFRNNSKDTWPIFLVFNELPLKSKFAPQNIVLVGLWCGQTKLNNTVIMNESMQSISQLEEGINICGHHLKLFAIYGSYDKPAKSLVFNAQSCTGKFGCMFCIGKCTRINKKPVYLKAGILRSHEFQVGKSIKAENDGKPTMGLKGRSSLR